MKWSEFLHRTDLIGGNVEASENGTQFRAPIEAIESYDTYVRIRPKMDELMLSRGNNVWEAAVNLPNFTGWMTDTDYATLFLQKDGSIRINIPYIGVVIIYPLGVAPIGQ